MIKRLAAAAKATGKDHKVVMEYLRNELLKCDLTKGPSVKMRSDFFST